MALDTAAKRQAVPGVGRPWMRGQLPSVGKGREWRSSAALSYPVANFQAPEDALVGGTRRQRQIKSLIRSRKRR